MLRSTGAHDAYLRINRGLLNASLVAQLLLRDRLFPRSAFYTLRQAETCLEQVAGRTETWGAGGIGLGRLWTVGGELIAVCRELRKGNDPADAVLVGGPRMGVPGSCAHHSGSVAGHGDSPAMISARLCGRGAMPGSTLGRVAGGRMIRTMRFRWSSGMSGSRSAGTVRMWRR